MIGISLYVYCIIANTPPGPPFFDADADYKFLIDGELVGRYTHEAEPNIPDYFYNTPVYVNSTLQNKAHNFTLLVDSPAKPVLLLFDYAVYTTRYVTSINILCAYNGLVEDDHRIVLQRRRYCSIVCYGVLNGAEPAYRDARPIGFISDTGERRRHRRPRDRRVVPYHRHPRRLTLPSPAKNAECSGTRSIDAEPKSHRDRDPR